MTGYELIQAAKLDWCNGDTEHWAMTDDIMDAKIQREFSQQGLASDDEDQVDPRREVEYIDAVKCAMNML